jgi:hypothetical protein
MWVNIFDYYGYSDYFLPKIYFIFFLFFPLGVIGISSLFNAVSRKEKLLCLVDYGLGIIEFENDLAPNSAIGTLGTTF